MKNFIPYNKLSPKQRRAVDKQSRVLWEISPVTRRPEKSKAYHRAKLKQDARKQAVSS